jgi:polyhydroxyalkanoate synthesis regulator phasin
MDESERRKKVDELLKDGEDLLNDEDRKKQARRKADELLKKMEEHQRDLEQKQQAY